MRKDVKFGLTVGAILVATIVVYVIVLTRTGAPPSTNSQNSDISQADAPSEKVSGGEQAPTVAVNTSAGHFDSAPTGETGPGTIGTAPGASSPETIAAPPSYTLQTPASPAPANGDRFTSSANPTTEPSVATESRTDWNTALSTGLPPTLPAVAPQRTQTPMIDAGLLANRFDNSVNRTASTPMIDSMPTTQPAPPAGSSLAANMPADSNSSGVTPLMMSAPANDPSVNSPNSSGANRSISTGNPGNSGNSYDPTLTAPPEPGTSPAERTHRITSGETLSSISAAVYGNAKYYKRLLIANPGIDPKDLKIGQMLNIPEANDDSEKNSSAGSTGSEAAQSVDPNIAYVIKSGDTLEKISRRLYGDGQMQEKLYQANRSLIGEDENVLKIGWILKLPEVPTVGASR